MTNNRLYRVASLWLALFVGAGTFWSADLVFGTEENEDSSLVQSAAIPEDIPPPKTSTEDLCHIVEVDMLWGGKLQSKNSWSGSYSNRHMSLSEIFKREGLAAESGCLDDIASEITRRCREDFFSFLSFGPDSKTHAHYYDDCFVATFSHMFFPDRSGANALVGTHSNGAKCYNLQRSDLKFCPPERSHIMGCVACGQGEFYLDLEDDKCEVVVPTPEDEICGKVITNYLASSPISLLWNLGHDIEAESSFVRFPLNPYKAGRWYEWKASEHAPLLVHDPEHKGEILSGAQLFGQWTFGGRQLVSLFSQSAQGGPWDSGYEALKVLDRDNDGILQGSELDELALWFDKNRDAVSDEGEVIRLHDLKVTKIFTTADRKNQETGSIIASVGYERIVDGAAINGSSVDWFGDSASSPFDYMAKIKANSVLEEPIKSREAATKTLDPSNLSGFWKYTLKGAEESPAGFLVISDHQTNGRIYGYSVVQSQVRLKKQKNAKLKTTAVFFEGTKQLDENGKTELVFTLAANNLNLSSKAALSSDLNRLEGSSTVAKGDKLISYQWHAVRVTSD